MHLFCCGIPALMAMTSLAALLGVSSGSLWEWEWYEAIEFYVLIASGLLLAISAISYILGRKLDCSEESECSHAPCDERKEYYGILLFTAGALYVFNIAVFLMG